MFKQIRTETKPLTPEYVAWFRKLPALPGDRDQESTQGKARIAWLADLCRRGQFHSPEWAIAMCNGTAYRVNGGHSSNMLSSANGHFPHNLPVFVRWFHCNTFQDVLDLFNQFDNRKSSRTTGDKTNVHKHAHPQLCSIPSSYLDRMIAGIRCCLNDGATVHTDDDDRTALLHGEVEFLSWCAKFSKCHQLRRAGVVACMYRSFYADCERADTFWTLVRDESSPSNQCPSRTLASFLKDLRLPENRHWDNHAVYVKCIQAWNAWQRGETTMLRYVAEAPTPKLVVKTATGFKSF